MIAMNIPLPLTMLLLWTLTLSGHAEEVAPGQEKKPLFAVTVTGSGRPMILIPGLSCGGNVWDGTVAHFKDRYECHVVTLAGFAGQPAAGREPMLEAVRDALGQYIRDKGLQRPVIVGHSLGAFMAFWLGATFQEEVGPVIAVDGVPFFPALLNPTATPESMREMAKGMRSLYKTQTAGQFEFGLRMTLRGMVTGDADFDRMAESSAKSDTQAVGQALHELMSVDLRPRVSAIRVPVLLVAATAMATPPEQKKQMEENYRTQVAKIPNHHVIFAPKARHFIQLDEPAFLWGEMERFLKAAE
ncbi:alpha/beta hydrolase [Prosthecobacter algae]|uniref:Alpha/beta hydrolase n=2 Tax=Prosthecobacter algae TaxID=1144682 RepID=A0ABP9PH06_9BACT